MIAGWKLLGIFAATIAWWVAALVAALFVIRSCT